MTTTNGTCALQACLGARRILAGAFLNLAALAAWIKNQPPSSLLLVGAGTFEQAAYEDTLAAGALGELVWDQFSRHADSAHLAREIYRAGASDLSAAVREHSRNARRLLANPELRERCSFCPATRHRPLRRRTERRRGGESPVTRLRANWANGTYRTNRTNRMEATICDRDPRSATCRAVARRAKAVRNFPFTPCPAFHISIRAFLAKKLWLNSLEIFWLHNPAAPPPSSTPASPASFRKPVTCLHPRNLRRSQRHPRHSQGGIH